MNQNDNLTLEGILPYLTDQTIAERLFLYDTIDSTNTETKRRAIQGAESGTVILADRQTAGRGRLGRDFHSPAGSGVYLSILLRLHIPMEQAVLVTTAASVVACRAVEAVTGQSLAIKWVNDLYLNGKKVCGILAEAVNDAIVVGIGINCTTVFDGELAERAGSLGFAGIRCRLAAELVNELARLETMIAKQNFLTEYRARSMILGEEVTILQEPGSCYIAEDIGDKGELILRDSSGNRRILSTGEISIRLAD
ncbi:MAG: biotin--[acetyl-CoA-carboxylase] ligase [Clostridia bacterium]|nr:biotin--[acetyl-CoA-carboxylase] ligase [Clostridia bacterium]